MITGGGSSCTNETTYAVGPWVGTGANFTVVDTPGFQDTDQVNRWLCPLTPTHIPPKRPHTLYVIEKLRLRIFEIHDNFFLHSSQT
jgi:hypothetical protein